ncbi:unnamed protein product [Parnassius apollo]|uniref:(apollo) hypothetical protein n=1 Tax=Parnassius apollo TaxID=110799 RepID=A0A8S3YCA3_PARAO|nr:unnamed protein product [Parnassius apollo]
MEMDHLGVHVMGLSETRWCGNRKEEIERDKIIYYSGKDTTSDYYGVAIIVNKHLENAISTFIPLSNRAMMIQLDTKPKRLNIIQTYAPTADKSQEDIENLYKELEELYGHTKKEDINLIMDIGSDHNPVIVNLTCRLKCRSKNGVNNKYVDISKLKDLKLKGKVQTTINEWTLKEKKKRNTDVEILWESLKSKI